MIYVLIIAIAILFISEIVKLIMTCFFIVDDTFVAPRKINLPSDDYLKRIAKRRERQRRKEVRKNINQKIIAMCYDNKSKDILWENKDYVDFDYYKSRGFVIELDSTDCVKSTGKIEKMIIYNKFKKERK